MFTNSQVGPLSLEKLANLAMPAAGLSQASGSAGEIIQQHLERIHAMNFPDLSASGDYASIALEYDIGLMLAVRNLSSVCT
jgi:hypothetical protein